jgi:hypothetical protein
MRRLNGILGAFLSALALAAAGCDSGGSHDTSSQGGVVVDDQLKDELRTIRTARLFFGHHSVGGNVLDGLATLSAEAGVPIEIVPINEHQPGSQGRLEHARIAENTKPYAKVDAFVQKVEATGSDGPQLALMKFCYVDFDPDTDVDKLFGYYQQSVVKLKAAKPGLILMHVTAPLMERPSGVKVQLNRLLGRPIWGDAANLKRSTYNEKLRTAYAGEPIFDLAAMESTRPDGSREVFRYQDQEGYALWPGYTADGGHLNPLGKRVAARALIRVLAEAVKAAGTREAAAQR